MNFPRVYPLLLSLLLSTAAAADVCEHTTPPNGVIELNASGRTDAVYNLENKLKGKAAGGFAWLTEQQLMNGDTAKVDDTKPFPLTIGYCAPDPSDATKAVAHFPIGGPSADEFKTAEALIIRFVPQSRRGSETYFLRLTDDKKTVATYKVVTIAGVEDTSIDSRYKLWLYSGYTYMRSKNDFKDGYPELLLRSETRWFDDRVWMQEHDKAKYERLAKSGCDEDKQAARRTALEKARKASGDTTPVTAGEVGCAAPSFGIVRIYAEGGLTGTAVAANGSDTTTLGKIKQTFTSSIGFGIGKTILVAAQRPTDTNAFSLMFVPRLGLITIPGSDDGKVPGRSAFNYSANVRIENEQGGRFEGRYFELGLGESEQFSRKKHPRIRVDSLLPIGGTDLFRFAGRVQVDAPRPFARKKADPEDNLANEIRISIVFNMDLLELAKRVGGE